MSRDETSRRVDDDPRAEERAREPPDLRVRRRPSSRREFIRRGTVIGMSVPLVGFLATACGSGEKGGGDAVQSAGKQVAVRPGGTLKLGLSPGPVTDLDPLKVADEGGVAITSQTGEFLAFSDGKLELQPRLAESWAPSGDGTVWTFKSARASSSMTARR